MSLPSSCGVCNSTTGCDCIAQEIIKNLKQEVQYYKLRDKDSCDQLVELSKFVEKVTGVVNNEAITKDGWPNTLVGVAIKALSEKFDLTWE